mgnify:CR=1 FL=1
MVTLSDDEIKNLQSLNGYDLTLEIAKLSAKYGATEAEIMTVTSQNTPAGYNSDGDYDPSPKNPPSRIPDVDNNYKDYTTPASVLDKSNFRFEYDPTPGVAERRQNIDQAIMCPGCGVALGIPAIRPIKITCPQCLQETTFSS